jgi:hypothetical protein
MGAVGICHVIREKADRTKIDKAFRERREHDQDENGHREGYSGDFQTVTSVDYRFLGKVYSDYNEAEDFCLDKAEKWRTVVAVYFNEAGETHTMIAGWGAE